MLLYVYYVSPVIERWGLVGLPLVCPQQTQDADPVLDQCWPAFATLAQHQTSTGSTPSDCLVSIFPVGFLCCQSVSNSFLSSALYHTGGQTRDVDPILD